MTDIIDFLGNVTDKNYNQAEAQFTDLLNQKIADKLDLEKAEVADKVFNNVTYDDEV